MSKPKSSRSRVALCDGSLCQFSFADGRTCRMLRQHDHPTLCIFHARAERQLIESDRLGAELAASLTGRFMTATDINFVLGKLFKAIAQNRIQPRVAANLLFAAKLMLQSLDKLKDEYRFEYKFEAWQSMERNATHISAPPPPATPSATHAPKPLPASAQAFADQLLSGTSGVTPIS
ncbi:MAG TPA: hypothetical protein VE263_16145 [Candidatus Angelobacter sp.]|nr:hypothetical protein [Candidatus Angelobacter sp.]